MAVSIALVVILGLLADYLFQKVKLPGLLGMLVIGILFGNSFLDLLQPELMAVSSDFRMVALIVILLRAGLELKRETLNRVGGTALLMALFPSALEGFVVACLAPTLLDITTLEGILLGTILAAVSPAAVVPYMIRFMRERRGTEKGIPTLVLSASSLNDVFVIVVFTMLIGSATTGETISPSKMLLEISESTVFGIAIGAITGWIMCQMFERYHLRATKMMISIVAVGVLLTWVEKVLTDHIYFSALLAVMMVGLVIVEKAEASAHKISEKLSKLWIFAEILVFVLIGAQVDIGIVSKAGLAGIALLVAGLAARSAGTFLSLAGRGFNIREKLFCVIAYTPKATVQAAIGAIALEKGLPGGEVILAVSVLSILVTAPLGALGIMGTGPRWLKMDL